ncbi:GNAT family N-acetyltransferase [Lactobacillus sp. ESL0679]|uniref:GNAT family N-acetyltransferase n=1 Tax=Lactobacillus sp. ESL0679 TaxID=2983209 RepID=UPI0023FA1951|nr:GNAT family N-acetyltransferase [Lactobacillus sp. ESL0679]MDF7683038.1 GNAT family N-acetyltransferase [Lactobacillus sp. ESL0679]
MAKRVYLRSFSLADAPVILRWGKDDYYYHYAGFSRYQNLAQAELAAKQYAARDNSYAICLQETQQVIGLVELYERGTNDQELLQTKEVGFLLDKSFSGHGYMTEALQLIFAYAFNQLDQTEIWAGTFAHNLKSQKLLQRLGFKYVYFVDLSKISHLFSYQEKYYLLDRKEWLKINANTES